MRNFRIAYVLNLSVIVPAGLLLGGCAHVSDPHEPALAMEVPTGWGQLLTNGGQIWPDSDWWKRLGSAELTGLVNEGRTRNLEIGAAVARVRQAESAARIAGAPLLPSVDFAAGASRTSQIPWGRGTNAVSSMLEIGYEVDFWGKNKAGLAAAQASLDANRYDRETVALTVTTGIVSTYLQVLSLRDQLVIARENVANAQRVLKLVEAQSRAGATSPLDLARQRSVVAGEQAVIPSLQQQEREARAALAVLLGRPAQSFTVSGQGLGNILLPEVSPGLPSELLARRPDIRRAEANLAAANANVMMAHAALFPSINLSGSAGGQSSALLSVVNAPNLLMNFGAGLVAPIFDADRLENQQALALAQKQELLQIYRSTVIAAFAEVDNALGQIRNLAEQEKLKQTEWEQARLAFHLSEARYRAGAEDLMTVLDTQRSLAGVQNELGQLKLKRLKATVSLYKALGGGWKDETGHNARSRADTAGVIPG
ncbi:efflux transporter outer membrane subunit [Rhodoferax sediminis]|uniref:Efflux transporter outer membrane subunit n=1 Tax=Rhodoferax sediminis TaxID=2509614 RepID=A0A515DH96_9BURK|nr:efflux transporter outer membrane subunit [Rhodoferax sediminis]